MSNFTGDFYDADYFERGKESKKGWLENYRWMPRRSFREAFAFIDSLKLDEKSFVLEFGCAKGFLIRALRELEIPACGCDISNYALSFSPYGCWNCSTEESWILHEKAKYTHILIKDVLEHLSPYQLFDNLKVLKTMAPKMMCVIPMGDNGVYRIPEYHLEVSHLIAEDEEWWRSMFSLCGWDVISETHHVNGLKDNWTHVPDGNRVFILERK